MTDQHRDGMFTDRAKIEQAARFRVDQASYLKQFETVFLRPIEKGYDAVAIGNGDLAAIVWQPGHLTWLLNKCDLSGEASQAARLTFVTPTQLAERLGRLETRLSLAQATATVKYTGGEFGGFKRGGWRGGGAAPDPQGTDLGALAVTGYVPDGRNVFLLDYAESAHVPHPTMVVLERWLQSSWGDDCEARVNSDTLAIIYQLRNGIRYAVVLAFDGFHGAQLAKAGPVKATLTLLPSREVHGRLAIAVVTSQDAPDPLVAATRLAKETLAADPAALRQQHRAAWSAFWDRFFVDAGHPYLNALYHVALYQLGISSRGRRPVKFNGALNLWNERERQWGAHYWCHNQTSVYLPVYAVNQAELADNFHDWIVGARPEAVKAGRKFLNVEGAYYPEVMGHDFRAAEPDKIPNLPPDEIGYILSSGTRYALLLWNRYQYSLDRKFLAEQAYPVIRDVAAFYVSYGTLASDGFYHVGPALSWEERPLGRDAHADCAAWRAIFPIAIEAATRLGADKDKIPIWQERLKKAPPYPVYEGRFSVVLRNDGTPEPANHWQWQMPNLSSVFPYGVIGIGSPASLRRTAEATFNRYRHTCDAGHEYLPVIAARLGKPDWVRSALFNYLQFFQVHDQGLFSYYNLFGNKDEDTTNQESVHPYLEASGILATTVNEMLLQSHDGTIRVFPALPRHWEARFILRAVGSFFVCSEHRGGGGIPYILIQSIGGDTRPCRVALPWKEGGEIVSDGQTIPIQTQAGLVEFSAKPEAVYALTPTGVKASDIPMAEIGFKESCAPARLGIVWYGAREGPNNHSTTFPLW
ncbi:MAG: hypothetical protein HY360_02840 [Verrucomicrobia bacterium]|nr:hypothetical protein [Verrucomicrobiota bacterium]